MNSHADNVQDNKIQDISSLNDQSQTLADQTVYYEDNRLGSVFQRKLQENANGSSQVTKLSSFQQLANNSFQSNTTIQLQSMADNFSSQQIETIQKKENNTGLPDKLKSGIENLSGYSMDDVKVHRNSGKPAQLQAHAYAQGTNIHLGPGQEKQLPHEAWHVVQQKQGRVTPTKQLKSKIKINDDAGLEKEADIMGVRALISPTAQLRLISRTPGAEAIQMSMNDDEDSEIRENLTGPIEKNLEGSKSAHKKDWEEKSDFDPDNQDIKERLIEGRENDVALRLKSLGFGDLIKVGGLWHNAEGVQKEEMVTWDFKHWMADGEMPPDYHYGFPVREYFDGLSTSDKQKFTLKCKTMRSATNITRVLGQYPLREDYINSMETNTKLGWDDESRAKIKSSYLHTRGIIEETRGGEQVGKPELTKLIANPQNLVELVRGLIDTVKNDTGDNEMIRPLEIKLTHVADEVWKEVSRIKKTELGSDGKKEFSENHQRFGKKLMQMGKYTDNAIKDLSGDKQIHVKRIFGKIIRSWGDATASIGYDPVGKMITDTQSSTTDDYFRNQLHDEADGDGGKQVGEYVNKLANSNAWCDMFASGSMWSQAANYDRYRDTIVTLYVQYDHGSSLGKGNDSDPLKLRVTAAELQLGVMNAIFEKMDVDGRPITGTLAERVPLDTRNQRDEMSGGRKGLPNKSHSLRGNPDEVVRDLGLVREMGDGSIQVYGPSVRSNITGVRAQGDRKWYKTIQDGDRLVVDFTS